MQLNKKILAMGAGAAVGAVLPTVLKKYVEPSTGAMVPLIGDTLGAPWGTYHVFVPLVAGGAIFAVTQFTSLIRNSMLNDVLAMFGFTALVVGAVTGVTEMGTGARAGRAMVSRPVARYSGIAPTPTGVSGATIVS